MTSGPDIWRCGTFDVSLGRPLVMGILNVTPDSFSDGGRFVGAGGMDVQAALEAGRQLVRDGADIVDVGGESTRPGAMSVHPAVEADRVLPVIGPLSTARLGAAAVPLSVDTRHAEVAATALAAGASIINDVSGLTSAGMLKVAVGSSAGLVVMHMRGKPLTMQDEPVYDSVVEEVVDWLRERTACLEDAGIAHDRIAVDPGIGFGKTAEHNLELLQRLDEIVELGYPVVVGVSRKRFIGVVLDADDPADRLEGSLAAAVWAASKGASVIRAHDVAATAKALRVTAAIAAGRLVGPEAGWADE